jgi:hypothetical protein
MNNSLLTHPETTPPVMTSEKLIVKNLKLVGQTNFR